MNFKNYPAFEQIFNLIKDTPQAQSMRKTVENSPWHREESTWVHTEMCLSYYIENIAPHRTPYQNNLTLLCLLAHDFGKPDAEQTLERKDGSGQYRSYAGHEKVSANEFINVVKDTPDLLNAIFAAGLDWKDIRAIKWMVENHLPYGVEKAEKRKALRTTLHATLGENEVCFFDQLISDANGRISDDHPEKLKKVDEWIEAFKAVPINPPRKIKDGAPVLYMLHGVSGAGKSTWSKGLNANRTEDAKAYTACEDDWRIEYAKANMPEAQLGEMLMAEDAEAYDMAWKFCHMNPESKYDAYATKKYQDILSWGRDVVLDRTNQTRKNRRKWIDAAVQKGFKVISIEFYLSEKEANARQQTRPDKFINKHFVHKMVMNMETPWLETEVDGFTIIT